MNEKLENLRKGLLEKASNKPIRKMYQIDGWTGVPEDEWDDVFMHADNEGDILMGGATYELRTTHCVRLQIPSHQKMENVIRILEKMTAWLKRSPENYDEMLDHLSLSEKGDPEDWFGGWVVVEEEETEQEPQF